MTKDDKNLEIEKPWFETAFYEVAEGSWFAEENREKISEIIYSLYDSLQKVYESLGAFYNEEAYQKALEIEFTNNSNFKALPQFTVPVKFEDQVITHQIFDFIVIPNKKVFKLVEDEIPAFILEIKKKNYSDFSEEEEQYLGRRNARQQLWRYLEICEKSEIKKLNKIKWGVLANFSKKLEHIDQRSIGHIDLHNEDDGVDIEVWYRNGRKMSLYIHSEKEKVELDSNKIFEEMLSRNLRDKNLILKNKENTLSEEEILQLGQDVNTMYLFVDRVRKDYPIVTDYLLNQEERSIVLPNNLESLVDQIEVRKDEFKDIHDEKEVKILIASLKVLLKVLKKKYNN